MEVFHFKIVTMNIFENYMKQLVSVKSWIYYYGRKLGIFQHVKNSPTMVMVMKSDAMYSCHGAKGILRNVLLLFGF